MRSTKPETPNEHADRSGVRPLGTVGSLDGSGRTSGLPRGKSLEEGIAEGPVALGGAVQVANAFVPGSLIDEPERKGLLTDAFDHRNEGVFGETSDQFGTAAVHIDHPRPDSHVAEARLHKQRRKPAANQRIAAQPRLHIHEALDYA